MHASWPFSGGVAVWRSLVFGFGLGRWVCLFWLGMGGVRAAEPSGEFFRDWLVCGPFPALGATTDLEAMRLPGWDTDWLAEAGGEAGVRPKAGEEVRYADGVAVWKWHRSAADAVDLDAAVSRSNAVVAYAYREIEVDGPGVGLLSVGSNDGARVWWNGGLVLDVPGPRGLKLDHHLIPVALERGSNRLLIKVEERGNVWGLACRLLPLEHQGYGDRHRWFEVQTGVDGVAWIRPAASVSVMEALVRSARFEVVGESTPQRVVWSGAWTGGEAGVVGVREGMALGVESKRFGRYLLRATVERMDGRRQEWTQAFQTGERKEQVLFEDGRSRYRIVVDAAASDSERWAAGELQRWLAEASGVRLPVVTGGATAGESEGPAIHVGWSDTVAAWVGSGVTAPAEDDESFRYLSVGEAILIWGGRQRGTMYGVMSFLERELGVRFYTPSVTVVPRRERWGFTGLDHAESPGIRVRNDFYFEAFDPHWAARNRVNGAMSPRPQPGGLETYWSVHTFYPLVPPEEFFAEHPEYYSLIDGVRTHERAQLCLTHPEVLRLVVDRLRQRMRESPEYLIYDVSQNDWAGPCACVGCQAIVDREGSQAGPVLEFVNQVADAVRSEFPNKYVGTLAYQYTRTPPRQVRPRDNVVVRLCSIECCFAHPLESCSENASFVADMKGWAAMAPHLYIWDYVVNFSHYVLPYPNFRVLADNLRFFRDHRAIGVMEQGAYQSRGGEFAELRAYVLARLLWNPEADVEPMVADFMHGYYGRAGQYVQAYFDRLHGQITPGTHIHLGLQPDDALFSDEFVVQAGRLFDQAETVADTEEIRRRVELARLPVLYLKCKRTPEVARQDGSYARFKAIAERERVDHYAESGEPHRRAFHQQMESGR